MSVIFITICFLFGLIIGSFLNVVIYRLPRGESVLPGSRCPHCLHPLIWNDLIPIIGYLGLRGRCRYCQNRISPRYPVVEFLTGVATVVWWLRFGPVPANLVYLLLAYVCIIITFIDLEHFLIPDLLTLPMIVIGLIFRLSEGEFVSALVAGLVGGGLLWLVNFLYPKGMGLGDAKLLAMAGVFTTWNGVFEILFFGGLLGTITVLPLILFKKISRTSPVPFGPFLVTATLMVIYR